MKAIRGAAFGLAAALLALALGFLPFIRTIELKTYDLRVRATAVPTSMHPEIVLVSIDDDSVRRLEPLVGRWPWPRLVHASLVDFLTRGGARAVVYDVLFTEADRRRFTVGDTEWTGEESDAALAESIAKAGNVVIVADVASNGLVDASKQLPANTSGVPALASRWDAGGCAETRPQLVLPIPAIARAARGIGHNLFPVDADGPVRRWPPFVSAEGVVVPSLALATAIHARSLTPESAAVHGTALVAGDARVPLLADDVADFYGPATTACRALVPYRGPTYTAEGRQSFEQFSFYDLFYAEQQLLEGVTPAVDPARFKDRIVIVGASAQGAHDVLTTPFGEGEMQGAEVHANVVAGLLGGRSLAPLGSFPAAGGTVALAVGVGIAGAYVTAWTTGALAAGMASLLVFVSVWAFAGGTWVPLVVPLLALVFVFVADLAWQYFVEGREKRQVKQVFSRFVARDVFDQLMADPTRAALGGRRREMTVLFSDVRGFTTLSEKGQPEDVVRQLNEYFSRMVQVLFAHQGTLDKFVGDMVMALFGAPLDDPDHAEHAVQAALAMTRALDELNEGWKAQGRPTLDIGIGVNTGEMVAGNIGSDTIMSYTVIGDAVNLGARLESLNKDYGTRIIVSEATRAALKGRYDIRPLGDVTVKGKSKPVAIYEIRPAADSEGTRS